MSLDGRKPQLLETVAIARALLDSIVSLDRAEAVSEAVTEFRELINEMSNLYPAQNK